jgi:hypothetical protein
LQKPPAKTGAETVEKGQENIVYFMGPYNSADISNDYEDANHLVVIHD